MEKIYNKESVENMLYAMKEIANDFSGKVGNVYVTSSSNYTTPEGRDMKIVNFQLAYTFKLNQGFELCEQEDLLNALKCNMSITMFADTSKFIPSTGDFVDLVITQAPRKDGSGNFPVVKSIVEIKATEVGTRKRPTATEEVSEVEETLDEVLSKGKK